jgi:hypothetical protein
MGLVENVARMGKKINANILVRMPEENRKETWFGRNRV